MPNLSDFFHPVPLSLYIHMPWCLKRCPYCDFNAHPAPGVLPEDAYIDRLIEDVQLHVEVVQHRPIHTVFIGGGTPSLFSPKAYERLFRSLRALLLFDANCEITMEANPGAVEHRAFTDYVEAGINRLSLGVQSFSAPHLKRLGRIHNHAEARQAIEAALQAGFNSINIDLMYGLPEQTVNEALQDLKIAFSFPIQHLSWYELTLEPNTFFYAHPPALPKENAMKAIEDQGLALIGTHGFERYEISAFTQGVPSRHNLNYWTFGDYIGIGAGAHGKLTDFVDQKVLRYAKQRHPKAYLDARQPLIQETRELSKHDLVLEFMLNTLRLRQGFLIQDFEQRTFQSIQTISPILEKLIKKGQLFIDQGRVQTTPFGFAFVNELLAEF